MTDIYDLLEKRKKENRFDELLVEAIKVLAVKYDAREINRVAALAAIKHEINLEIMMRKARQNV